MTTGGWINMALSVGFVTALVVWSIWRVLTAPEATQKLHSQADIDTHEQP